MLPIVDMTRRKYTKEQRLEVIKNVSLERLPLFFQIEPLLDPVIMKSTDQNLLVMIDEADDSERSLAKERWRSERRPLKKWKMGECLPVILERSLLDTCADRVISPYLEGKIWVMLRNSYPLWVPSLLSYGPERVHKFLEECPWPEQTSLYVLYELAEKFEFLDIAEEAVTVDQHPDIVRKYLEACCELEMARLKRFDAERVWRWTEFNVQTSYVRYDEVRPRTVQEVRAADVVEDGSYQIIPEQDLPWLVPGGVLTATNEGLYCRG